MMEMISETWPLLEYTAFKSTRHLLHMGLQAIGKFKLYTPFEPHWANVGLWLTSRGLTTGLIPFNTGSFSIEVDMIDHRITVVTTWELYESFDLTSMSVAEFTQKLLTMLQKVKIDLSINLIPQEIPNPIPFNQDTEKREYDKHLAHAWWKIMMSSYQVMERYHAQFDGESPPVCLMWGTFDLRDARYNGKSVVTTGENAGYIRRNAMNEEQVEIGWWPGNEGYPKPAYFSFIYPEPKEIAKASIKPEAAHWDDKLHEFVLDYENVRSAAHPEKDLFDFFTSTFQAGAKLAGW
jgi:hypothetical protein